MKSIYNLAQADGRSAKGTAVCDYTVKPTIAPQTQVLNKTPMHSRTQPDR